MLNQILTYNFLKEEIVDKKGHQSPILQVISIRKVFQKGDNHKQFAYKLSINDGTYSYNAILHSLLNHMIELNEIKPYDIIKLTKYTSKPYSGSVAFIIRGLEVIDRTQNSVIGSPTQLLIENYNTNANSETENKICHIIIKNQKPCLHCDIVNINPYIINWTITARIVCKSPIKIFNTPKGQKQYCSMIFKDQTGEIEGILYDEEVSMFYNKIEVNGVYDIENGLVTDNRRTRNKSHNYQIKFTKQTRVKESTDDGTIGFLSYHFEDLQYISSTKAREVDFIGIITRVNPLEVPSYKFNSPMRMVIELCDQLIFMFLETMREPFLKLMKDPSLP